MLVIFFLKVNVLGIKNRIDSLTTNLCLGGKKKKKAIDHIEMNSVILYSNKMLPPPQSLM